jgi:hypothetical protein
MPSGLRRSPVVEADGRAPMERQAVAKIAREVPPDTDRDLQRSRSKTRKLYASDEAIKIGVSSCLLGAKVRFPRSAT